LTPEGVQFDIAAIYVPGDAAENREAEASTAEKKNGQEPVHSAKASGKVGH
jgi:hypothetical protein